MIDDHNANEAVVESGLSTQLFANRNVNNIFSRSASPSPLVNELFFMNVP